MDERNSIVCSLFDDPPTYNWWYERCIQFICSLRVTISKHNFCYRSFRRNLYRLYMEHIMDSILCRNYLIHLPLSYPPFVLYCMSDHLFNFFVLFACMRMDLRVPLIIKKRGAMKYPYMARSNRQPRHESGASYTEGALSSEPCPWQVQSTGGWLTVPPPKINSSEMTIFFGIVYFFGV